MRLIAVGHSGKRLEGSTTLFTDPSRLLSPVKWVVSPLWPSQQRESSARLHKRKVCQQRHYSPASTCARPSVCAGGERESTFFLGRTRNTKHFFGRSKKEKKRHKQRRWGRSSLLLQFHTSPRNPHFWQTCRTRCLIIRRHAETSVATSHKERVEEGVLWDRAMSRFHYSQLPLRYTQKSLSVELQMHSSGAQSRSCRAPHGHLRCNIFMPKYGCLATHRNNLCLEHLDLLVEKKLVLFVHDRHYKGQDECCAHPNHIKLKKGTQTENKHTNTHT